MFFSSGFMLMIKLFAAGGSKIGVGLLVMIVTLSFAIIAFADGLLLMKVRHKNSFVYALISLENVFILIYHMIFSLNLAVLPDLV